MRVASTYKQQDSANLCILSANEKAMRAVKNIIDSKKLEQLSKIKQRAEQVAHDIKTPLTILSMALNYRCKNLSKEECTLLRNVMYSIKNIAQELLELSHEKTSHYDNLGISGVHSNENNKKKVLADQQHILVSKTLDEIVEQKKLQYIDKDIDFQYSFDSSLQSAFIYGKAINFERMISNVINNSVEAYEGKHGIVKIKLINDDCVVKIVVEDNGKGMPIETMQKLMLGKSVSTTKKNGHGIGTQQIQCALAEFYGLQRIQSTIDIGTRITLIIPKSVPE